MKNSSRKSYDELPLFLNTELAAKVLGMSPFSGYELQLSIPSGRRRI